MYLFLCILFLLVIIFKYYYPIFILLLVFITLPLFLPSVCLLFFSFFPLFLATIITHSSLLLLLFLLLLLSVFLGVSDKESSCSLNNLMYIIPDLYRIAQSIRMVKESQKLKGYFSLKKII